MLGLWGLGFIGCRAYRVLVFEILSFRKNTKKARNLGRDPVHARGLGFAVLGRLQCALQRVPFSKCSFLGWGCRDSGVKVRKVSGSAVWGFQV